jgi:hypothetical protein
MMCRIVDATLTQFGPRSLYQAQYLAARQGWGKTKQWRVTGVGDVIFEALAGAAVRVMDGTRLGARLLGHPIDELEQAHQGLRPMRAELWQERAQQSSQQIGSSQPGQSGSVDSNNDVAGDGADLVGNSSVGDDASIGDVDGGGVLDFFGDALDWVRDLL